MTTRSVYSGAHFSAYELDRTSSGGDGKKETVNGRPRSKWNNYTLNLREERRKKGTTSWLPCASSPPFLTYFSSSDQNRLLDKLSSKASKAKFNLAVDVVQGKQTIKSVVDLLSSVGLAALDAKRGNFTSAIRRFSVNPGRKSKFTTKDISSRWLELQYGWLPTISDVYEASKLLEQSSKTRTMRSTVSISVRKKHEASESPSGYSGPGICVGHRTIISELSESLSVPRSLGLVDPLSVVWEVIPWSFVIDWCLPIGTYLSNLNSIPKLNGRFLTTDFIEFNEHAVSTPLGVPNYAGGWTNCRWLYLNRTLSTSLKVPIPSFISLPDAMSPKRIYNAMALAHQRFRVAGLG